MKRKIKKYTDRSFWGPIAAGVLAILAIATYKLSTSEAGAAKQTVIMAPARVEPTSLAVQEDNTPAPDFTLQDLNGQEVRLSDFKGKVVVLNFWATWCPPCRKEIPDFNELQAQYGERGVQFIGVALDEEGLTKVKKWTSTNPVNYPVVIADATIKKAYGEMNAIPVTLLIDRQGMIRTKYIGMRQKAIVESMIAPLLSERS
ncbi:MAG TPA: TlpA disulfide reductase family protein [Candidatus Kapabacteria bacterium]|nr:TlpA disulfide reductase family protein [Candidatus Kapabacteria bacterium]